VGWRPCGTTNAEDCSPPPTVAWASIAGTSEDAVTTLRVIKAAQRLGFTWNRDGSPTPPPPTRNVALLELESLHQGSDEEIDKIPGTDRPDPTCHPPSQPGHRDDTMLIPYMCCVVCLVSLSGLAVPGATFCRLLLPPLLRSRGILINLSLSRFLVPGLSFQLSCRCDDFEWSMPARQ
jgi:hypothetical protein